jgi:hypothetical protein
MHTTVFEKSVKVLMTKLCVKTTGSVGNFIYRLTEDHDGTLIRKHICHISLYTLLLFNLEQTQLSSKTPVIYFSPTKLELTASVA